jgi:hypothetical protein
VKKTDRLKSVAVGKTACCHPRGRKLWVEIATFCNRGESIVADAKNVKLDWKKKLKVARRVIADFKLF